MQSVAALYLARPDVTWKLVLAVCFGTGTLITTPRANILPLKTLFTCLEGKIQVTYKDGHTELHPPPDK